MAAINYFEAFQYAWAEDGSVYDWEESQYKQGWATIGDIKPSVEQFNNTHQIIDQKANYLFRQLKVAADNRSVSVSASKDTTLDEMLTQVEQRLMDKIYPIGCVEIMANDTTPASRGLPGTWEQIKDGFLYAHGAPKAGAIGSTGGATDVTLTEAQMPSHSHSASSSSAGNHSHTGSTNTTGAHTHTRGSMNITGSMTRMPASSSVAGAFTRAPSGSAGYQDERSGSRINFDASRSWTGVTSSSGNHSHSFTTNTTGNHTHSISIGNKGGGQSHTNMPPYVTVRMYKRVS